MSTKADPDTEAGWVARIRAACRHMSEADEAAKLAHEARDEMIVEALEAGYSTRTVARWAGISQPRVNGILSRY